MKQALSSRAKKFFFLAVFGMLVIQTTPTNAQDSYRPKSENAATALSMFGTILPVGTGIMLELGNGRDSDAPLWLVASGLIVGPSLGYFYARLDQRAWKGVAIRSTVVFATLMIVTILPDGVTIQGHVSSGTRGDNHIDDVILAIGSGVVAISALTDILSVSKNVKERNQKLYHGNFTVLPKYFPQHKAGGLQLQILF